MPAPQHPASQHLDPKQLSDAQLAEALAMAEAEERAAQARAEALRTEGWRRRGKVGLAQQLLLQLMAFSMGCVVAVALAYNFRFGLEPALLGVVFMLPASVWVGIWATWRHVAPDQREQWADNMREQWELLRLPVLIALLIGLNAGVFVSWFPLL